MITNLTKRKSGFTLVETVVAMGIIAILITAFLGAFSPAIRGVQKAISTKDVNRLASTLENEFAYLNPADRNNYGSAFEKAYEWIDECDGVTKDTAILLYQYRGDPESPRPDGTFSPISDITGHIPGEDYVLQSVVRRLGDPEVIEELQPGVVEGRLFYVKITQMIFGANGIEVGTIGEIIDPTLDASGNRDAVTSFADYPEAVIAYQAEFYSLKSSIYSYVSNGFNLDDENGDGHPEATGRSVFTRSMGVRR